MKTIKQRLGKVKAAAIPRLRLALNSAVEIDRKARTQLEKQQPSLLLVALAVVVFWLVLGAIPLIFYRDVAKSGPLGDSFGLATSFFSGMAFTGVALTLWYQHRELAEQRESAVKARKQNLLQQQMIQDANILAALGGLVDYGSANIEEEPVMETKTRRDAAKLANDLRQMMLAVMVQADTAIDLREVISAKLTLWGHLTTVERLANRVHSELSRLLYFPAVFEGSSRRNISLQDGLEAMTLIKSNYPRMQAGLVAIAPDMIDGFLQFFKRVDQAVESGSFADMMETACNYFSTIQTNRGSI